MQPDVSKIKIADNEAKIVELLDELIVRPRLDLIRWSRITKQTPNLRIGYPGQHLASLVTGVEGSRTGARGHDIADGSEVKSCSRIDQLDKCNACGAAVARLEEECPSCAGTSIKRNNDSKWLFGIRSEAELEVLTQDVDRVLLMLGDHPNFDAGDYSTLRFQAFEIWPKHPRHALFTTLMENYYYKIYQGHKAINPTSNPAPKNFWPYSYQFYLCNPINIMTAIVEDAETDPKIRLESYIPPGMDRSGLPSLLMPAALLNADERQILADQDDELLASVLPLGVTPRSYRVMTDKQRKATLTVIDEEARACLPLRDTDTPVTQKTAYRRRALS